MTPSAGSVPIHQLDFVQQFPSFFFFIYTRVGRDLRNAVEAPTADLTREQNSRLIRPHRRSDEVAVFYQESPLLQLTPGRAVHLERKGTLQRVPFLFYRRRRRTRHGEFLPCTGEQAGSLGADAVGEKEADAVGEKKQPWGGSSRESFSLSSGEGEAGRGLPQYILRVNSLYAIEKCNTSLLCH